MRMEKRRDEFKCKTCGRSFATYQALGGHRTGHSRPKEREEKATKMKVSVHECSVCGLTFSMGQALGGHMRRHKNLEFSAAPMFVPAMNFDLNLIPMDDDDEDDNDDHHDVEEVFLPELNLSLGLGL